MGLFDFLKRENPENSAQKRRERLLEHGRITDGTIIDATINDDGEEVAVYHYNIHGVDFELSDILTDEQREDRIKYAPGAGIAVRFDPKNHHNSIIV